MNVDDVAGNIHNRFQYDGVFSKHRDVVFVAHSLGGLVVERLLLHHHDLASQVRFIYFFGTPQTGSEMAAIGHMFTDSSLMESMFPGDHNLYLSNLRSEWRDAKFGIKRYCGVERLGVAGNIVVPELSGEFDCNDVVPIPKDHINLVKPCSTDDDAYIALKNSILETPLTAIPPAESK
jgi:pimeloyl-ACP methyl ester carboxylesterase